MEHVNERTNDMIFSKSSYFFEAHFNLWSFHVNWKNMIDKDLS